MLSNLHRRLTFANVVSLIALFVALGGSSYAAVQLKQNSVLSKHIRDGQVASADVKNASLRSQDFAPDQLPRGEKGEQGAQGEQGLPGAPGQDGEDGTDADMTAINAKNASQDEAIAANGATDLTRFNSLSTSIATLNAVNNNQNNQLSSHQATINTLLAEVASLKNRVAALER